MTEQQKNMKKYCNSVERRLNLPRDVRTRVMNDFISSIAARREAGESDEQIFAELGTPKEAAELLNEQMREYAYRKSKWRWLALAVAAVSGGVFLWRNLVNWLMTALFTLSLGENASLGVIGGADGPTAIFVTTTPRTDYGWILTVAVMIAGLAAWWCLGHMKKK
mgnify:CR=1 FL=1